MSMDKRGYELFPSFLIDPKKDLSGFIPLALPLTNSQEILQAYNIFYINVPDIAPIRDTYNAWSINTA